MVRDAPKRIEDVGDLEDMLSGAAAYVSDTQLRPVIDWEMGENDEEAEVRPSRRQLAVNGRHRAFRAAETLDGKEVVEGTELESLQSVGALTVHVVDAACLAWGKWHLEQSRNDVDELSRRYSELKVACLRAVVK